MSILKHTLAVLAALWLVPALAEEMPDKDRWHVGETAATSGYFCATPEGAAKAVAMTDTASDSTGTYSPAALANDMMAIGCVYLMPRPVTFVGVIPQSRVYRDKQGSRFYFVEWIMLPGTAHAYSFMPVERLSDKPLELRRRAVPGPGIAVFIALFSSCLSG